MDSSAARSSPRRRAAAAGPVAARPRTPAAAVRRLERASMRRTMANASCSREGKGGTMAQEKERGGLRREGQW